MTKMGRPKGDNNKEKVCTIRMDEGTLKRLEAYCQSRNLARSEAIREAITKMIDASSETEA